MLRRLLRRYDQVPFSELEADLRWAIALACQKERGPAPKTGTEIAVRVVG